MKNWICKAIGRVNEHCSKLNGNLHDALKDVHSLMIPACFNQHWYLCVVNLKDNTATVIDGLNSDAEQVIKNLLLKLLLTLQYYHENTERIPNFNLAKMKIYKTLIPIQQDYSNCGVIVLKTIYGLMKSPSIIYSSNTTESIKLREYTYFELMKASQKEYDISIDNTQDNEINYWDNISVFYNISKMIAKSQTRGKKKKKYEYKKFFNSSKFSEHKMSVEGNEKNSVVVKKEIILKKT